jgi:heparin/heparan-sulfate lyase
LTWCSWGQEGSSSLIPLYSGHINKKTAVVRKLDGRQGVALRRPVAGLPLSRQADLEVELVVPETGYYVLESEAAPLDVDALKSRDTTGLLTNYAYFQIGDARRTKRIVYDRYKGGKQELGKFKIAAKNQKIKIWIPDGLLLSSIAVKPYVAPVAPAEAIGYQPKVVPGKEHPRLWVNQESLPVVRARLLASENKDAWEKVKRVALRAYPFEFDKNKEIFYDEKLEQVIEQKAFYYLMTADEKVGLEAVDLAVKYLAMLEFGNVTYGDITRELGRAIYTGSLVYDWCYPLLDTATKSAFRADFGRLVRDMEIGWPPFYGLESIINGHGNEAQICRDMLSWSLAVYDEDPEPYKYISYTILEQLVPMRKFEYQSPRHNQGIDYGGYRFGWEMHAVWLYYRMLGYSVFDDNIKNMSDYWLYMRTPDGKMLRDGDMFNVKYSSSDEFYWKNPQTMLLCYAFSGNRIVKGEFYKQGGLPDNPVLFLLLNDPNLQPDYDLDQLALTKDFGPVLGSMVARTGWDQKASSDDVIAEIKGGGFHFGNHQHADAGALQIYYRGMQVGDLGLYLSYGSPYDFNFNKRSVSHSMMLAVDPNEKLLFRTKTNDGGTRFSQRFPKTAYETQTDPWFNVGYVRSSAVGDYAQRPSFSYFNVDLTAAYSAKMSAYSRGFLFLNLGRKDVPAIIILTDEMRVQDPGFKKYWQINTLNAPVEERGQLVLTSSWKGKVGKTYVNMLLPREEDRTVEILGGKQSSHVFGTAYDVNSKWPEASGYRIMYTPKDAHKDDRFLTVFQMVDDGAGALPLEYKEFDWYYLIQVADKIICISKGKDLIEESIRIAIPDGVTKEVIFAGVKEGFWHVSGGGLKEDFNVIVDPQRHVLSFQSKGGEITVKPGRSRVASESVLSNN